MSALKTYYGISAISEQVNDLTLTFITPLRTNDNDVLTHVCS
jgi:hypothetical protein